MKYSLLLPTFLILAWVLHHNIRKNSDQMKQSVADYLARESEANMSRRKDISNLPYITVPLDTLPFDITLNDKKKQLQIEEYIKEIKNLSDKKMLNLMGISNTELKASYGPANLEVLSLYDQTYARYIRTLQLFADCIYEEYPKEAVSVLEYCISIGTDISATYDLLGRHYLKSNNLSQFEMLYEHIPDKESLSGKNIISKLDRLRESIVPSNPPQE